MIYDFNNKKRDFGRVIFALTLDRKRKTERIVIGKENEVRRFFEFSGGDVYYEKTRPIGSWLFSLSGNSDDEWNQRGMILRDSYNKTFLKESERWKMVKLVSEFLKMKYDSNEPTKMFAAIRTWEDYLNCYNLDYGADKLTERLSALYKPFGIYNSSKPWNKEAVAIVKKDSWRDSETSIELWYPVVKRPFEVAVISSSILPLIVYYLHKLEEWKYQFRVCKICDTHFLAPNRHYALCSDDCRKKQAVITKREFEERHVDDNLDKLDNSDYNYWYNQLRKLKKEGNDDAVKIFKDIFDKHRKEAVKKKAAVKKGRIVMAVYTNWLFSEQVEADNLLKSL